MDYKAKQQIPRIYYWFLCWLNDKGYYSQSYGKNHKIKEEN